MLAVAYHKLAEAYEGSRFGAVTVRPTRGLYVMQQCFWPGNRSSGPDVGRTLIGKPSNRPSGRPSAGRRADFEAFPSRVRPKSGPEARCPARKHYCIT